MLLKVLQTDLQLGTFANRLGAGICQDSNNGITVVLLFLQADYLLDSRLSEGKRAVEAIKNRIQAGSIDCVWW